VIRAGQPRRGIELIRGAADPPTASARPDARVRLSELQAQEILEMRCSVLTGLERSKILEEHREVLARIAHLEAVLGSEAMVLDIIVEELQAIRSRYGDDRRTRSSPKKGRSRSRT